jgi:hypothetical protein
LALTMNSGEAEQPSIGAMEMRKEAVIRQYLTFTPMGCGGASVPTEYRRSLPVNRGGSEVAVTPLALVVSSGPLRDLQCGAL